MVGRRAVQVNAPDGGGAALPMKTRHPNEDTVGMENVPPVGLCWTVILPSSALLPPAVTVSLVPGAYNL